MSEIRYRSLTPEEVPEACAVFLESMGDLARRNGIAVPGSYSQASVEPVYRQLQQTGIFEVAEVDGRIAAICSAIVRGELWFLAMFWVRPALQLRGVGKPLLARVRARGEALGARVFATWSSIDFAAVGMYLREGMLPQGPIFRLSGKLQQAPEVARDVSVAPIDTDEAVALEFALRDVSRPQDHAFWHAQGARGFAVLRGTRRIGGFYLDGGVIGPAFWADDDAARPVLASALAQAAMRAELVQLIALGVNRSAVSAGIDAGLRIGAASHLLSSATFGALERYLPSGPALF